MNAQIVDPLAGLRSQFDMLESCCLHDPKWHLAQVAGVIAAVWSGDYSEPWQELDLAEGKPSSDSESYTVVRLADGRFGLLAESEDYTGHGCQCGSSAVAFSTLPELLRYGVEEGEARKAIIKALVRKGLVQS